MHVNLYLELTKIKSVVHLDLLGISFHPLKNINVWSDAGMIVTNNRSVYTQLKLLRNHGLINRDVVDLLDNSRMDTVQAVVGNWILPKAKVIARTRITNAKFLDKSLSKIKKA